MRAEEKFVAKSAARSRRDNSASTRRLIASPVGGRGANLVMNRRTRAPHLFVRLVHLRFWAPGGLRRSPATGPGLPGRCLNRAIFSALPFSRRSPATRYGPVLPGVPKTRGVLSWLPGTVNRVETHLTYRKQTSEYASTRNVPAHGFCPFLGRNPIAGETPAPLTLLLNAVACGLFAFRSRARMKLRTAAGARDIGRATRLLFSLTNHKSLFTNHPFRGGTVNRACAHVSHRKQTTAHEQGRNFPVHFLFPISRQNPTTLALFSLGGRSFSSVINNRRDAPRLSVRLLHPGLPGRSFTRAKSSVSRASHSSRVTRHSFTPAEKSAHQVARKCPNAGETRAERQRAPGHARTMRCSTHKCDNLTHREASR
jgi:hypothetical protein